MGTTCKNQIETNQFHSKYDTWTAYVIQIIKVAILNNGYRQTRGDYPVDDEGQVEVNRIIVRVSMNQLGLSPFSCGGNSLLSDARIIISSNPVVVYEKLNYFYV